MLTDYAKLGTVEVWNTSRLQSYLTNVGSPFDNGPDICHCDTLTSSVIGDTPYTTPSDPASPAPWYDAAVPDSAAYLGFLPLTVEGIDDSPYARSTTNTVGGGGVFGPVRQQPRTITVTGVIIGSTCCGAAYGLHFLTEALAGTFEPDDTELCESCSGSSMTMYNCCPDPGMTDVAFNTAHKRTYRRVSTVSGPTVTRRRGSGTCASSFCSAGSELIEVEFVIVAATPWAFTTPVPVLDVAPPIGGQPEQPCVDWCFSAVTTGVCEGEQCLHQDCTVAEICLDPLQPVITPPGPTLPDTVFCTPLAPERSCYLVDLSSRPAWAEDVPMVTIEAGDEILRNIRITFYEKPDATPNCNTYVDTQLCNPADDFFVTFVPADGTVTIDGQTGRSFVRCGGPCVPSTTVYSGTDGGPLVVKGLKRDYYCVCIETDPNFPPSATANVSISMSGRGY